MKIAFHALLFQRSYNVARALHQLSFRIARARRPETLLVFTPGHVGSMSVVRSLQRHGFHGTMHAIHRLQCRQPRPRRPVPPRLFFLESYLADRIRSSRSGRWKVITLVRDPLARAIGGFFQSLHRLLPGYAETYAAKLEVDRLLAMFLDHLRADGDYSLRWFELEILPSFGIDVYGTPFPRARGYQVFEGRAADLLLIRLESLDGCFTESIEAFLGLSGCSLLSTNRSEGKPYAPILDEFRRTMVLSPAQLDRFYASRYATHFYSGEEIAHFRGRFREAPASN